MSLTTANKKLIVEALESVRSSVEIASSPTSLDPDVLQMILDFHENIPRATSAFTNIVTCLISNVVDNSIDPRYHRKPGDGMPEPETGKNNWFSGRTISEKIIYNWLDAAGYRTAKSGWQTRTFERPKPYSLEYEENIAHVKSEFLGLLDLVVQGKATSKDILVEFFRLEEIVKSKKQALYNKVAKNTAGNELMITDIMNAFQMHFVTSARTPVLAIYAVYKLVVDQIEAYDDLQLLELGAHEAADIRTGAIGDIELADSDGDVIEALEIKHNIPVDLPILTKAEEKIRASQVKRYYILTTHKNCNFIDTDMANVVKRVYDEHGCQIIINGVVPTMKYYLRLVTNPSKSLDDYGELLTSDKAIRFPHVQEWEKILNILSVN